MKTKKLIAAALAAGIGVTAVSTPSHAWYCPPKVVPAGKTFGAGAGPWPVFICAGGIIFAALAANYRDNRQLTAEEAWTCGALFLLSQPKQKGNAPLKVRG